MDLETYKRERAEREREAAQRRKTLHLYVLPAEPLPPVQVPPQSREVYIAMLAAHERKLKREQQRVVQRQDRAQSLEAYIRGMLTMHEHKLKREQQRVREYQLKIQHYEAKAAEPVQAIPSPAQIRHEAHIREKLAEHRCRFEHEQELVRLYRTKVRYYERKAAASQNRLRK